MSCRPTFLRCLNIECRYAHKTITGLADLFSAVKSVAGITHGIEDCERMGVAEAYSIVTDGDGVVKNGASLRQGVEVNGFLFRWRCRRSRFGSEKTELSMENIRW